MIDSEDLHAGGCERVSDEDLHVGSRGFAVMAGVRGA
jgi:hypothetical protein